MVTTYLGLLLTGTLLIGMNTIEYFDQKKEESEEA